MKNIKKTRLLFAFLFLTIFSCNRDKADKTLKIRLESRQPINITDVVSSMEIIKLETSDECLLADIKEIKISNSLIYISDVIFKGIYVFDLKGNLIKKLEKEGKGEGEYLSVDDFLIDNDKKTIEIFDRLNMKIHIYSLDDFSFKKSISLPFSFSFKFLKANDIYYFQTNGARNQIGDEITNSEIISYDSSNKKVTPLFERILPKNENQAWEFNNIFTTNDKNRLFVSLSWHDKLYQIEENKINPIITIEAGNKAYPRRIIDGNYETKMSFLNSSQVDDKLHFFKLLMKEGNDIIVGYGIGYPPKVCYYLQLNNGQDIYNTNNIVNNFLPFRHENINIFKIDDNSILSVIYPYKEVENKQIVNYFDICPEDNPVILLFKLKQ